MISPSDQAAYLSLPRTDKPATARAFAESPSVKMRVHSRDWGPPAQLAS